ncbi:MAG: lipoyl(octanoyl) transferase LipB [bacterium]
MRTKAIFIDGPAPYAGMADAQDRLLSARIVDEIGDTVLFVEHLPVVTIGRRGDVSCLLKSPEFLARKGIAVSQSTRGGNVTYHAPGQIVMYPILKLTGSEADVHCYTTALEEIAIRTAADFRVRAFRRSGMTGAWTDHGKLAAIGVRLKRWTTSHGMSFNVNVDLSGFDSIVPCGLRNESVTSLEAILGGKCPQLSKVRDRMARHFSDVLGRQLEIRRMTSEIFLRIPNFPG